MVDHMSDAAQSESDDITSIVRADARSTLIGYRDKLTEPDIEFICDQIARKSQLDYASLAPVSRCSAVKASGLAPCPFCGSEPQARQPFGIVRSGYEIACVSDDCMGPHTTAHDLDDCIRQWNTRAQPQGAPVTQSAAVLAERLIQAAADYESGRCSKREMAEARAAVEAAIGLGSVK